MSSLMNKPFKLQQDNQNYIISVCSSAGNPCMENDGKLKCTYNLYFNTYIYVCNTHVYN